MANFITEYFRRKPKIWFVSDLHFGHKNVISYCNRPFKTVEEMNDFIVSYWNKTIKKQDTIFVLGDFSLNKKWSKLLIPKLNGKKILVAGNHDACFVGHKKHLTRVQNYLEHGWEAVYPYNVFIKLKNGLDVQLCHLPYVPSNPDYDVRYLNLRPKRETEILLHGHMHGMFKKAEGQIDVGWDAHESHILSEDDIIKLIEDKRSFIPSPLTEYYKINKDNLIRNNYQVSPNKAEENT